MQPICPKDTDVAAYMGHKLKISRADEEFIGIVSGWADIDGARPWVLVAANASTTFLPSEGWEIHDCTPEGASTALSSELEISAREENASDEKPEPPL